MLPMYTDNPRKSGNSELWWALGTVVAGLLLGAGLIYALKPAPPAVPAFANGQMVRMKAFDATGMVVAVKCWPSECYYDVRFPSLQLRIPNGGLFSNGGPVDFSPVSKVEVREFEIEAI